MTVLIAVAVKLDINNARSIVQYLNCTLLKYIECFFTDLIETIDSVWPNIVMRV